MKGEQENTPPSIIPSKITRKTRPTFLSPKLVQLSLILTQLLFHFIGLALFDLSIFALKFTLIYNLHFN